MKEEVIELHVERKIDALDRRLINGTISLEDYGAEVRELDAWAERKRAEADKE